MRICLLYMGQGQYRWRAVGAVVWELKRAKSEKTGCPIHSTLGFICFFFLLIFVLSDNFLSLILTANAITT